MVSRILIILSIALIPALTLMSFNIWNEFSDEKQKIRDEAFRFAEKIVIQQQNKINYTKMILLNLARDGIAQDPADPNCSLALARILRLNPLFSNLGVPLANGDLLCNALPLQQALNVADRPYFRNTIDNGLFSMSRFQHDRATDLASMNFSVPVYDKDNHIIAAAVGVISLEWWGKHLTDNFFPEDGAAFIVDHHGQVVASHYDVTTASAKDLIAADLSLREEGVYEVVSADNIRRLLAYKPMLSGNGSNDSLVIIALPLESAYANAYAGLQRNILTLLFSLLTLVSILFWGLRVKIITPIYQLLDTAKSLISEHFKDADILKRDKIIENQSLYNNELSVLSDHFNLVIAEQKKQQQELKSLVYLDHLTELPNRHALLKSIESKLGYQHAPFALILIDLDNFGVLNDRFGHDIGDALLVEIANRLTSICQDYEEVARWCGDEFVCILPYHKRELLENRINCFLASISEPIQLGNILHSCQARCGVVLSQELEIKDASKLMHFADLAVAKVGDNAANQISFFRPEMEKAGRERFELEVELRDAVEHGELCLHYQPIINFKTGEYELAEALVRWQHPTRGMVPPFEFIELAEKTGLIINIGRWVVCEAIRQLAQWQRSEVASINNVAVNLSPVQFQDAELIDIISSALAEHELDAQFLTLEITESVLIDGDDKALAKIAQFRSMGIQIALDDFGTGYSSLSYLSRIQLDKIKIDRSFVNKVGNSRDEVLIETIIAMSHSMNLSVVAEGIEELPQLDFIQQGGCEYGQGYYFSKPLAASEVTLFMLEQHNGLH